MNFVAKMKKNKGKVYLVGAGPGRADLITVRGAELIKTADCIICDRLAEPALLRFARQNTEIINVPKRIGSGSFTQAQINRLLVEKAALGQTVVRLKGGDACIFGRGSEEARLLARENIDFEIVPGVTAAVAAAEYAGIMLTDRQYSSQVVFVTGKEANEKQQSNIDWQWLAGFTGTIVFYMPMGSLDFIIGRLMKNGMKEDTPAVVIADATLPGQRVVKAPLARLSQKCRQEKIEPPAVMVIGAAAESDPGLSWFMKKPLFGKNIVVTRDARGNADFAAKIIQRGANPMEFAAIKIKPLTQGNKFLQALAKQAEFDWIIFTSANGVAISLDCLQGLGKDARVFSSAKIAAIGSETADELARFGIKADFVPNLFTSEELGRQLIRFADLQGKKILLLRSGLASNELAKLLTQAGAQINELPVYTIVTEKKDCEWLKDKISKGRIDWLTFASPSAADSFFEQIPADLVNSKDVKVASIGPVTSGQLKNLGVRVDVTAAEYTINGLLAAVEEMYL